MVVFQHYCFPFQILKPMRTKILLNDCWNRGRAEMNAVQSLDPMKNDGDDDDDDGDDDIDE